MVDAGGVSNGEEYKWLALEDATLAERVDDRRAGDRQCHVVILALGRGPVARSTTL